MKRKASAVWNGTGMEGNGSLNTPSGVLNNTPYSFTSRFKNEDGTAGTNPEELIAAAHAGCFSMALSFALTGAGFPPTKIETEDFVTMENVDGKNKVTGIHLKTVVTVDNIDEARFSEIAETAKATCPISQLLSAVPITLDAKLNG